MAFDNIHFPFMIKVLGRRDISQHNESSLQEDLNQHTSSKSSRTDAYMSSKRTWQHTQDLHRCKPDWVSALRGGSGHGVPPLTKKLFAIDTCWQMEKSVFLYRMSLGISTILQGRAHTKDNLTNTK